jgi:hypothetical protein
VVVIVSAVPEPTPELLPLLDDELLPELLEDDELPLLEDEPLPLELELELVTELLSLLLPLPQAATARHEMAASKLSGSVEWRMKSVLT